jgi:LPS export ABC transporter protein LptC
MSLPIPDEAMTQGPQAEASRPRLPMARIFSWLSGTLFVGLIAAFIWQAGFFASLRPTPNAIEQPAVAHPEQVAVGASRYTGSDRERQPYWVEAKSGVQDATNPNQVHLDSVTGELRRVSGEVLAMQSDNALYDTKSRVLELQGGVKIDSQGSYIAKMSRARVVVEDKSLDTDVPVTVTFANGRIDANGMKITDDGKRIVFFNRVKARFEPGAAQGTTAQ